MDVEESRIVGQNLGDFSITFCENSGLGSCEIFELFTGKMGQGFKAYKVVRFCQNCKNSLLGHYFLNMPFMF